MYVSSFHSVSPCFVTSFEQVFCTVTSCFVTNETNETDHQWELLLVCFICFILFQSILEYSLYILIVTSVSVTEKKTCPKKTCVVFVQYLFQEVFNSHVNAGVVDAATEDIWNNIKTGLLKTTEEVFGITQPHHWSHETWWWNEHVKKAIAAKWIAFKAWKTGKGTRASYDAAKRIARQAVHHARQCAEPYPCWGRVQWRVWRSVFTKARYPARFSSSLCLKPCHASSPLGSPGRTSMPMTLLSSLNCWGMCQEALDLERSNGGEKTESKCKKDEDHDLWYGPGHLAEFRRVSICRLLHMSGQ